MSIAAAGTSSRENKRVELAAAALDAGDLASFGALMLAGAPQHTR